MKSVTAIITARGGSKGIPRKNLREINGKPLIAYTIDAAKTCPEVDACYVTTDDGEIRDVSLQYGAKVIDRPIELAGDKSLSQDAVIHALDYLKQHHALPEHFALLQPTSPLRTHDHLSESVKAFFTSGKKCLVAVTEAEHHPWKMLLFEKNKFTPVKDAHTLESPRQTLPKAFRINGAIYIIQTKIFLERKSFYVEPAHPYFMSQQTSIDIDIEDDLRLVEKILSDQS